MRIYELVFIVSPEVEGDSLNSVVDDVMRYIERAGGRVLRTDPWGLRRLAYPIRDNWEGYYFLMYLEFDPSAVAEFERSLRLIEPVMRHLIVLTQDEVNPAEQSAESPLEVEDDGEEGSVEDEDDASDESDDDSD